MKYSVKLLCLGLILVLFGVFCFLTYDFKNISKVLICVYIGYEILGVGFVAKNTFLIKK